MKIFTFVFLMISMFVLIYPQSAADQRIQSLEEHGFFSGSKEFSSTESNTDSTGWTSLPAASTPFGRVVYGVVGDYLYIFSSQGATSLAMALHIPTNTWTTSTPPNSPGYNCASCVANGEIYKLSGSGSISVFEKFTPTSGGLGTWTTLVGGPSDIMNAQNSMTFDGSTYIYVSSADYSTVTSSFFARYNLQTAVWESLTGSPHPKRYGGLTAVDGKIYLIGGLIPTGVDPQVCQVYNPATSQWSTIAPIPEAINFAKWSTTTDGRYVYLVTSGGGYSTYPSSDNVYYYDPVSNQWHLDCVSPASRGLAVGLFLTNHNKLFFGGGNAGGTGSAYQVDCWTGSGGPYIPVELTSFSYELNGELISLKWSTASETNNQAFEIQKSLDNKSFNTIGRISGIGNSTAVNNYSFTDIPNTSGIIYYRLKQIDFNGEYSYSNVIEVYFNHQINYSLNQNFPNPFNPSTSIKYSIAEEGLVTIKVFNSLGCEITSLINEIKSPGNYSIEFTGKDLPSGLYFYKIETKSFSQVKKMMLVK